MGRLLMNCVWAFLMIAVWDALTVGFPRPMDSPTLDMGIVAMAFAIPLYGRLNRPPKPGRTAVEQMMGVLFWFGLVTCLFWFHVRLSDMLSWRT